MRRMITKKLSNNKGESIGETLIALLISTLALVMLAGAIGSAVRIITKSNEAAKVQYNAAAVPDTDWQDIVGDSIRNWSN